MSKNLDILNESCIKCHPRCFDMIFYRIVYMLSFLNLHLFPLHPKYMGNLLHIKSWLKHNYYTTVDVWPLILRGCITRANQFATRHNSRKKKLKIPPISPIDRIFQLLHSSSSSLMVVTSTASMVSPAPPSQNQHKHSLAISISLISLTSHFLPSTSFHAQYGHQIV